jgi:hypothetical protein
MRRKGPLLRQFLIVFSVFAALVTVAAWLGYLGVTRHNAAPGGLIMAGTRM